MNINHPRPFVRPVDGRFSPGPSRKHPDWDLHDLRGAVLGRSHRSAESQEELAKLIALTREVLCPPADYHIAIVAGSDTGAVEMAMWNLLGPLGVDVAAWDSFGDDWIVDAEQELPLSDLRVLRAVHGQLPDLYQYTPDRDLVFTWNGTTAGVRVPAAADFISDTRQGLTICDATSAAFAQDLPWHKLDVTTYSWQKVMGGEAAHGMMIVSPRALERLRTHTPAWPVPKLFRMRTKEGINESLFAGVPINTPSLLCVHEHIKTLEWVRAKGGLAYMHKRADENAQIIWDWIEGVSWIENLCTDTALRSNSGVCLRLCGEHMASLLEAEQKAFAHFIVKLLGDEGVAYDFAAYHTAPAGFRIWASGLVRAEDIIALLEWLEWGYKVACDNL